MEAAVGLLRTTPGVTAIVGRRVRFEIARPYETMPYLIYQTTGLGESVADTGEVRIEKYGLQFKVYSLDGVVSVRALEEIEKAFERTSLALEEGECLDFEKTGQALEPDPDQTEEGENVWMGIIAFDFTIQHKPKE